MPTGTSGNILFDTNVYLRVLHSELYAHQHRERFSRLAPRTFLCSVVAGELYAGAVDIPGLRTVDRLLAPFAAVNRVVFPNHHDWVEMGRINAGLLLRYPRYRAKLMSLQNDILIAMSARRIGAAVVTENARDFQLIQEVAPFSLLVLRP